jgi:hypothetical protein
MSYEKPDFVEIKMDAEIGSYQNDFDPSRDPSFATPAAPSAPADAVSTEG